MIDKNTPKPVFSRDEHYQKKQAPQRMVYHAGSSSAGGAGRNSPAKRVNYHAGAAGVYTRKTTTRMDFSSSSASQASAADRWRTGTCAPKRSSPGSWRTESPESLCQSSGAKVQPKNNSHASFGQSHPESFVSRQPVRNQSFSRSAARFEPTLEKDTELRSSQERQTVPRAGRPKAPAASHLNKEPQIRVPWFSAPRDSGRRSVVPVSTETVLQPIEPSQKTGTTVVFPALREEEDENPLVRAQSTSGSRQAEEKRHERSKPAQKKKKRKSAWKRRIQAREEKKRNAPEKTPEQLKRIRTIKKVGLVSFATLAVLICAFVTSFYLFKIETITVVQPEGGTAYQNEQIVQAFGTPLGNNLFGYSAQKVEADMTASLPYLESVSVKRVLPDQVTIEVTPAVETYQIESAQGGWVVLSATQKVLRLAQQAQESGLITVRGTKATQPVSGIKAVFEETDKQEMFTQIMQQVNEKGLLPINEVDLTDSLEMNLLYAGRIRIILGTINDIAYKVDWAWRLVTPQLEESLKETATGILDVSTRTEEGRGKASYLAGSTEIVHNVQPSAQSQTQEITDPQAVSEPSVQE